MTDAEWFKRCDELAVQQPVLFPELVCFMRDGVPADIGVNRNPSLGSFTRRFQRIKSRRLPVLMGAPLKLRPWHRHRLKTRDNFLWVLYGVYVWPRMLAARLFDILKSTVRAADGGGQPNRLHAASRPPAQAVTKPLAKKAKFRGSAT